MGNFKESIGKKLQMHRKAKGYKTQQLLADAICVDRTRVSRWESGENIPDPIYRDKLITMLELPEDFFDGSLTQGETSTRAALILEIQAKLLELSEQELKTVSLTVNGLIKMQNNRIDAKNRS